MKKLWFVSFVLMFCTVVFGAPGDRCGFWIDLYAGEPVEWDDTIDDLASCDAVFLGEAHKVGRHHDLQQKIVRALADRNKKVLLGIEQMESMYSVHLDAYNNGTLSFEELAEKTDWAERWKNYAVYRPILEAALESGGRVVALNARSETIRSIGRKGLDSLDESARSELPGEMNFDDPVYERLLDRLLMVHMAFSKEMLRNVYHAQVARDETMAERMAEEWSATSGSDEWIGVVLCGSGHCSYGLGTASRLSRRIPDLDVRIVLMTESGDTVLSESEKAMKRDIEISHRDLRFINRPIADYLHAVERNPDAED